MEAKADLGHFLGVFGVLAAKSSSGGRDFAVALSRSRSCRNSDGVVLCGQGDLLTPVTENLLREMADVVSREVNPEAIVLFGSHARGDAHPDSDVDLLVIESASFGPGRDRRAELTRLWRLLARFVVAKDILVYSRAEVERWRNSRNHVIGRSLREGRVLFGQP